MTLLIILNILTNVSVLIILNILTNVSVLIILNVFTNVSVKVKIGLTHIFVTISKVLLKEFPYCSINSSAVTVLVY